MKDLYDYINITNIPLEKRIELSIAETKKELSELTEFGTCKLFSRHLATHLNQNHVVSKIVSTKELGADYDHYFIIVPINTFEYYLVDLKYPQFQHNEVFKNLYEKGYEKVTDLNFYLYYAIVTGEQSKITIQDVYLNKTIKKR